MRMNKSTQEEFKFIRELISKNRIEQALKIMQDLSNLINDDLKNKLMLTSSRYYDFKTKNQLGLGVDVTEKNKIILALLNLVSEFEEGLNEEVAGVGQVIDKAKAEFSLALRKKNAKIGIGLTSVLSVSIIISINFGFSTLITLLLILFVAIAYLFVSDRFII